MQILEALQNPRTDTLEDGELPEPTDSPLPPGERFELPDDGVHADNPIPGVNIQPLSGIVT